MVAIMRKGRGLQSVVFVITLWFLGSALGSSTSDVPVVRTPFGDVAGQRITSGNGTVDVFLGIPFAQPPVGNLRLRKPLPALPWTGVLNATAKPRPCWQLDLRLNTKISLHYLNSSLVSEDCLYLNLWRPARACPEKGSCDAKLPVVVYIYGGGFQWGDSAIFFSDPENFVAMQDVIYVTFNYRVGLLGFLTDGTKDMPGNFGLWDQNLVLRWVQSNIESFGGNRDDVTLTGFSAGAISVGLHAISPVSQGLFNRMILQSGTPLSLILGASVGGSGRFLETSSALGCSHADEKMSEQASKTASCLRKLDAESMYKMLSVENPLKQSFTPRFGDDFLPKTIFSVNFWKSFKVKQILIGTTRNEGSAFLQILRLAVPQMFGLIKLDYRLATTTAIASVLQAPVTAARKIVQEYFGDDSVEHTEESVFNQLSRILGDLVIDCPTELFSQLVAEQGSHVYRYLFSHRPSYSFWDESDGVTHMDDLAFTLGYLAFSNDSSRVSSGPISRELQEDLLAVRPTSEELLFMRELISTWSSFMKNGKPSLTPLKTEWPKYSEKSPWLVNLQPMNYTALLSPWRHVCQRWKPYFLKQEVTATTTSTTRKPKPPKKPVHTKQSMLRRPEELQEGASSASPLLVSSLLVVDRKSVV